MKQSKSLVARPKTTLIAIDICRSIGDDHLVPILRHVLDTGTPHWPTIHKIKKRVDSKSKVR